MPSSVASLATSPPPPTQFRHLAVTLDGATGVRTVRINKPDKKNAINRDDYKDIMEALQEAKRDERTKVVVLTGTGDYYSSGADLEFKQFHEVVSDPESLEQMLDDAAETFKRFISCLIDFPKLLVALVNGPAVGVAATTLALCDLVYAVTDSAFVLTPFVKLALVPEGCSTYTFPRLMGPGRATEMLVSGKRMAAAEAEKVGLYTRLYTGPSAKEQAMGEVKMLAALPMRSVLTAKKSIRQWDSWRLHEVNAAEVVRLRKAWTSDEFREVVFNFVSNRGRNGNRGQRSSKM